MPEFPDITVYIEALDSRIGGQAIRDIRFQSPFILRSVVPDKSAFIDKSVVDIRRLGKRIAIGVEDDYWIVIHLMIAGRFQWQPPDKKIAKSALAAFCFDTGNLVLTEAGSKKRASIHLVHGGDELADHDPKGLEIADISLEDFSRQLTRNNHTLKRALTDPKLFSGIGNAYSDEILHRARLSPIKQTQKLDDAEIAALHDACQTTLTEWTDRLRVYYGDKFPTKVTAFREDMAVHGRYQQACVDCGTAIQRIRYAANEVNYCPRCQTDGKVLADRSLSRLLKKDWPRTIEELESLKPK